MPRLYDQQRSLHLLFLGMRVCELRLDDSESEVEEEEGANEDEGDEEDHRTHTHPLPEGVHNVAPALQRHALEHSNDGVEDIIEVVHSAW